VRLSANCSQTLLPHQNFRRFSGGKDPVEKRSSKTREGIGPGKLLSLSSVRQKIELAAVSSGKRNTGPMGPQRVPNMKAGGWWGRSAKLVRLHPESIIHWLTLLSQWDRSGTLPWNCRRDRDGNMMRPPEAQIEQHLQYSASVDCLMSAGNVAASFIQFA
jgi:hypothetical protein